MVICSTASLRRFPIVNRSGSAAPFPFILLLEACCLCLTVGQNNQLPSYAVLVKYLGTTTGLVGKKEQKRKKEEWQKDGEKGFKWWQNVKWKGDNLSPKKKQLVNLIKGKFSPFFVWVSGKHWFFFSVLLPSPFLLCIFTPAQQNEGSSCMRGHVLEVKGV